MKSSASANGAPDRPQFSVIIPTLNAAKLLTSQINALSSLKARIIISDGESEDETQALAHASGADVVAGAKGRGAQLARGADVVCEGWLLFLHVDTKLSDGAVEAIRSFTQSEQSKSKVGYFTFKLDREHEDALRLERRVAWRCQHFALPYGDQGLLIHRDLYQSLGGFKPIPLMEDVDLIWRVHNRLGKAAVVQLDASAVTSAEKFERDGYFRRSARNLFCLFLFRIGVSPHLIVKLY